MTVRIIKIYVQTYEISICHEQNYPHNSDIMDGAFTQANNIHKTLFNVFIKFTILIDISVVTTRLEEKLQARVLRMMPRYYFIISS